MDGALLYAAEVAVERFLRQVFYKTTARAEKEFVAFVLGFYGVVSLGSIAHLLYIFHETPDEIQSGAEGSDVPAEYAELDEIGIFLKGIAGKDIAAQDRKIRLQIF